MSDQRGSASLLVVAAGTLLVVVVGAAGTGAAVLTAQNRAAQAADLAALAGAEQAWSGRERACAEATGIAAANQADVESCETDGLDVQVRVRVLPTLPLADHLVLRATARAGPPDP